MTPVTVKYTGVTRDTSVLLSNLLMNRSTIVHLVTLSGWKNLKMTLWQTQVNLNRFSWYVSRQNICLADAIGPTGTFCLLLTKEHNVWPPFLGTCLIAKCRIITRNHCFPQHTEVLAMRWNVCFTIERSQATEFVFNGNHCFLQCQYYYLHKIQDKYIIK